MPSNTASGYPYPLPTEPVKDGAVAIKNLADAVQLRFPLKRAYWFKGGLTTNAYGGIAVNVGFTVGGALANTGQNGYICDCPNGAPANTLWVDVFGSTGALVPNTFIIFNILAWGV